MAVCTPVVILRGSQIKRTLRIPLVSVVLIIGIISLVLIAILPAR